MKIQYLSLLAVCAIAASCTTENLEPTIGEKSGLYVSLEQPESETLTKGLNWTDNKLTFAWEEGELLSVFNTKGNAYTNFTSQESGTSAQFTCEGFDLTNGNSYITALPPSVINYRESAPQIKTLAVSFLNQTQNGADNTEHLKNYLYAYSSASEVADNKLTIDLQNQVAWIILQYTNTDEAALEGIRSITMSIQDNLFVTEGTMDATGSSYPSISGTNYAKELTLSFKEPVNIAKDETLRAYFTISPADLQGQGINFTANLTSGTKDLGTYNGANMTRNKAGRYTVGTSKLTSSVKITGIRGMEGRSFATMAEAYDAGKALLEAAGDDLKEGQGDFSIYTDGGNITWSISGQHELDETDRPYFLTFGRKAQHYGTDKHIGLITITGVNDNTYDALVLKTGITAPYEWWGDETLDKVAIRNLTLSSTTNQISVSQAYCDGLELTVDNCNINASWYCCINNDQKTTFTNNVFNGTGTSQQYALFLQGSGNTNDVTTLTFTGNTVSGYTRGININQDYCQAEVKDNTITSGQGYSAIQVSSAAKVNIEKNTIYNTGDIITIHESFADRKLSAEIALRNNTVNAVDGIQGYLIYDDVTAAGKTYGEDSARIKLIYEDNTLPANTIIAQGIKGEAVYEVSPYLLEQLGIRFGYNGEILPAAPAVNGNVITVNKENAQYTLDGAYGSIDGKTINFSAGTYDRLYFGRSTKFAGSNTLYRHGSFDNETISYADFIEYKNRPGWTEGCFYERPIENVTFTAEEGAVLTGMTYIAGDHIYGTDVYDHVRDASFDGSVYYQKLIAKNIVYDGIDFQYDLADTKAALDIETSSNRTDIDGVVVKNCTFTGNGTISNKTSAIRFYWEQPKETTESSVRNLTVESTNIDNFYQGIYTQNAYGVNVSGCTITNTVHNAIAIQSGGNWAVNHGKVVIKNNTFENISDRIMRFNLVAPGTSITITGNNATNSGDRAGEVIKATTLGSGITYDIHDNNWGEGKTVANDEFKDAGEQAPIADSEQLKKALAGATAGTPVELTLAAGEFSTNGLSLAGKTVTIKGEGQDKTILNAGTTYPASNGANVVFDNLTIIGTDGNYTGFQHSGNVTFKNVHFKGVLYTYSSGVDTFENCTFEPTVVGTSVYPVVCYGGLNTVFKNCEFKNGQGKGILVYNEGDGADRNYNITISECTFTATGPDGNGAIEIHTERWPKNTTGTITINNTTCDKNFGGGLWREWYNIDTKHTTDYFRVVVDGKTQQKGSRQ